MKYFAILTDYIAPMESVVEITPEHRAYLKTQYDAGIMLFSGPLVPRTGGMLFAQANDRADIDAMIARDPFHLKQIATYTVIETSPVMWATELNKIFEAA
ncbi:MAG: YciI family protein [bacterium]